jgi:hypothetical protein
MRFYQYGLLALATFGCRSGTAVERTACDQALAAGAAVVMWPASAHLFISQQLQLNSVSPAACAPIRFVLSPTDTAVASISANGILVGRKYGHVTVRALSADGVARDSAAIGIDVGVPLTRLWPAPRKD